MTPDFFRCLSHQQFPHFKILSRAAWHFSCQRDEFSFTKLDYRLKNYTATHFARLYLFYVFFTKKNISISYYCKISLDSGHFDIYDIYKHFLMLGFSTTIIRDCLKYSLGYYNPADINSIVWYYDYSILLYIILILNKDSMYLFRYTLLY